jgi:hypothetical protein
MPDPTPKSVHQMSIFIWKQLLRNCSHSDFFKLPGSTSAHFSRAGTTAPKLPARDQLHNEDEKLCKTDLRTCLQQAVASLHLRHCNMNHVGETVKKFHYTKFSCLGLPPARAKERSLRNDGSLSTPNTLQSGLHLQAISSERELVLRP